MAERFKGIKILIEGETKGLDAALKNIDTSTKSTQNELKKVNRLLKLDPKNSNLLLQKQKLLKDAISQTSQKLKSLKDAEIQAQAAFEKGEITEEQYRDLQREIAKTEQKLNGLEKEAKNFGATMSEKALVASARLEAFGNKAVTAGQNMRGISTGAAVALGAAVKTTADFDAAMGRVKAIIGATSEEMVLLEEAARKAGATTMFSAKEAAEGLENLASAGFNAKEAAAALPGLLDLAAVSGGDLGIASEVAASTLRAFGLEANQAGHVADVFARAAADTNAEALDMGEAMSYVAPVAKAMGISLEETAAAIGIMSDAGIKGSQAGTTLRGALARLAKPTTAMNTVMEDLGLKFYDAKGKMIPLKDQVIMLQDKFKGLTDAEKNHALTTLYGQQSLSGMMALIEAGPKKLGELTGSLKNSDGAARKMADTMTENLSGQLKILKSSLQEAAITIGKTLVPTISKGAKAIQGFVDWFSKADTGTQKLITSLIVMTAAAAPVMIGIGKMSIGASALMKTFGLLSSKILATKNATTAATTAAAANKGATSGLFGILRSHPYVAAAAGIALLTAAVVRNVTAENKNYQAYLNNKKAREEAISQTEAQVQSADRYKEKLDELISKEDKSALDKEKIKTYVDKLNESVEGLNLTYDDEKDKLNKTSAAIDKKIDAMKREAMANAYREKMNEVAKETAENEIKKAEALEKVESIQNKIKKLEADTSPQNARANNNKILELQTSLKSAKKDVKGYENALKDSEKEFDKYANATNKLEFANSKAGKAFNTLLTEARKAGIKVPKALSDGIKGGELQAPKSIGELKALMDPGYQNLARQAQSAGIKIPRNISNGLKTGELSVEAASKQLRKAINKGTKDDGGTKKNGSNSGKNYKEGLAGWAENVKKAGEKIKLWGVSGSRGNSGAKKNGSSAGSGYKSGLASWADRVKNAGESLKNSANKGTSGSYTKGKSKGSDYGKGYKEGLAGWADGIYKMAAYLAEQAEKGTKKKQKSSSPSKVSRGLGKDYGAGYGLGILDMIPNAKKAAEELHSATLSEFDNSNINFAKQQLYTPSITRPSLNISNSGAIGNELANAIGSSLTLNTQSGQPLEVKVYVGNKEFDSHIAKVVRKDRKVWGNK